MQDVNQLDDLIDRFCTDDWKLLINERSIRKSYKENETIFREGDHMTHISIVKSGKVKIFSAFGNRHERIYRFATDGQVIGHRGLGSDYIFPVSAVTLTETVITCIPLKLFQSVLRANADFCYYLMLYFAEELRRSEQQMKDLSTLNLRQRMAAALKMNALAFGFNREDNKKLGFTVSRKDLSSLAGTTYESIIRTLSEFEKEKLIELSGKEIRIIDLMKLQSLIPAS